MSRSIKFGETLKVLIEERGLNRNRQKLCTAVGITPAALSQYINHQTKPSLEKLVLIADYFTVTLDYLILGEQLASASTKPIDYGPLAQYIDQSIAETQRQVATQTALVGQIGALLGNQVAEVARELSKESTAYAGMITDNQTLELEHYATDTTLATMNLHYDVLDIEDDHVPGRFLPIVARNLAQNRTYRFLLPPGRDWEPTVRAFRTLLAAAVDMTKINQYCKFGVTKEPYHVGFGIYQLDTNALQKGNPYLYTYVSKYLREDRLGYVIPASTDQQSDSLMDITHLSYALESAEKVWKTSTKI